MAYPNGLKSPRDEPSFPTYAAPIRTVSGQFAPHPTSSNAERASVTRRFTTNAVPTLSSLTSFSPLSPIGQQRRQAMEQTSDMTASVSRFQFECSCNSVHANTFLASCTWILWLLGYEPCNFMGNLDHSCFALRLDLLPGHDKICFYP